jgi:hypothetical protein
MAKDERNIGGTPRKAQLYWRAFDDLLGDTQDRLVQTRAAHRRLIADQRRVGRFNVNLMTRSGAEHRGRRESDLACACLGYRFRSNQDNGCPHEGIENSLVALDV